MGAIVKATSIQVERKNTLISFSHQLSEHEKEIIAKGTEKTIKQAVEEDKGGTATKIVEIILERIQKGLGVTGWSDKDIIKENAEDTLNLLTRKYKHLTFKEVAFALSENVSGSLDPYFVQINGRPDKGHFGKFSLEHLSKVLNAYLKMRAKVYKKVRSLKEKEEECTLTEEEKDRIGADHVLDLYMRFEAGEDLQEWQLTAAYDYMKRKKCFQGVVTGKETFERIRKKAEDIVMLSASNSKNLVHGLLSTISGQSEVNMFCKGISVKMYFGLLKENKISEECLQVWRKAIYL